MGTGGGSECGMEGLGVGAWGAWDGGTGRGGVWRVWAWGWVKV